MKRILSLIVFLFTITTVYAGQINHIVFFGDSLTDNGNLYHLTDQTLPKSPPYFMGRFTNGYTWAEDVGKYFYDRNYIDYKIYAYGGATALAGSLVSLDRQIDNYFAENANDDASDIANTLFAIWIGANDYLFATNAISPDDVVNKISSTVISLIDKGARYFIVLNLPNLGMTPFAKNYQISGPLQMVSRLHNQKLQNEMLKLEKLYPEVKLSYFDVNAVFEDLILNLSKYNEKYHMNIQNITQACWGGGLTLQGNKYKQGLPLPTANNIMQSSPELMYVNSMTQSFSGIMPCANAESYIFWDQVHPTEITHQVLAQLVAENLMQSMFS